MLEVVGCKDAFDNLKGLAFYPTRDCRPERLTPYPTVRQAPKFTIKRDSKVFAIGSCFAMSVEGALCDLGVDVLSRGPVSPQDRIKYTTKSVLQDLLALGSRSRRSATVYEVIGGVQVLNFSSSTARKVMEPADCAALVSAYYKNLAKIAKADVVVMTLGLVESWFDRDRKSYINVAPTKGTRRRHGKSFELHVLDYGVVLEDLRAIVAILSDMGVKNVLLTVSPVPLAATFRGLDCIEANAYSKSVQRAAAEVVCRENDSVAYLPSYEMVTHADLDVAWGATDYRHVHPDMVSHVVGHALRTYMA